MAIKKGKGPSPSSQQTKPVGLVATPHARIQTAEGWRRSMVRRRKSMKAAVKR